MILTSGDILSSRRKFKSNMIAIALIFVLLASLFPVIQGQSNEKISIRYTFNSPTIKVMNIEGIDYDRVTLTNSMVASNPGEPNIPSKGAYILLPPDSKAENIIITTGEKHIIGYGYNIDPVGESIPMTESIVIPKINPNPEIYNLNGFYPGKLFTEVGTYSFRGYQILYLLLHPVQYNPVTGELYYYENMRVTVQTSFSDNSGNLFRGLEVDKQDIMRKVDNPDVALLYENEKTQLPLSDSYELLILTTDSLKSGFEPLKQAHDAEGVATVIKTLTDVGASDLNSIRNYIRDAYTNLGISYVLIGGDDGVVPAPILWVSGMDENITYYEDNMPSDLFYACLDGPYNYDGDSNWGEPNDGAGGGDVDLVAEVYVGRACVDNAADVNNFVTKTVDYINKNPDDPYLKNVIFAAEYLGDYGIASYGSTYMEQLEDGSSDDGYTTVGIPSDNYTFTELYDSPSYYWDPSELISLVNNGVHIINHLGHASYDYNMKMYSSDISYFTNDKTCFIYSQGCMSGGFDDPWGYDCIAEDFTVKTSHAAFAGIWNARYGFFWSYSTDGDSQRLHRQFWDAVFGEGIPEIGKANHDSKEDNLPIIGRSCIRWVYYETNLFGDPSLKFFEEEQHTNTPPDTPTITGANRGNPNTEYEYTVATTDFDADNVYYFIDWGDNLSSGWIGPYESGQSVKVSHTWSEKGNFTIKVKAKDIYDAESDWATFVVTMPRSRSVGNWLLLKLLERFPNIERLLQSLK